MDCEVSLVNSYSSLSRAGKDSLFVSVSPFGRVADYCFSAMFALPRGDLVYPRSRREFRHVQVEKLAKVCL